MMRKKWKGYLEWDWWFAREEGDNVSGDSLVWVW